MLKFSFLLVLLASPCWASPIQYTGDGYAAILSYNATPNGDQIAEWHVGAGSVSATLDPDTGHFTFHAALSDVNDLLSGPFPFWMTQPVTFDLTGNFEERYLFPEGFLPLQPDGFYLFDMNAGHLGSNVTIRDYQGNVVLRDDGFFLGESRFGLYPGFSKLFFYGIDFGGTYQGAALELTGDGFGLTEVPEPSAMLLFILSVMFWAKAQPVPSSTRFG